jgi:hypothetical protein
MSAKDYIDGVESAIGRLTGKDQRRLARLFVQGVGLNDAIAIFRPKPAELYWNAMANASDYLACAVSNRTDLESFVSREFLSDAIGFAPIPESV